MAEPCAPTAGPLAGVRVLDLTRLLPGPMCTLYLAQLGADVIKIEDTSQGDYARTLGTAGATSVLFELVNRGKRSIAIDLKQERGRKVFLALAATANVVVESFRPGVVRSLRIDADTLRAINPRLVYASITGYGQEGPRAAYAGHDINYLACSGVLDQIGTRGGPPAVPNLQIADLLGGAAMPAIGILAALHAAQRTGIGSYIDVAMADAALAHNVFPLQALAERGAVAPRGDDLLTGGAACYGIYATLDGRYLAVGALEDKFWRTLCGTLGRPDLVPGGRAIGETGERTRAALAAIFAARTLEHWSNVFAQVDCCVTPVATLDEALRDPQFIGRGMVLSDRDGRPMYGPAFRVSGAVQPSTVNAPSQGEHTRELLRSLGYDGAEIDSLVAAGTVLSGAAS
ncbi:MAG: CoA transferase [Pseudomonadota bacterium]|nr:CoA transferase [Pseudomonadota bacterium]